MNLPEGTWLLTAGRIHALKRAQRTKLVKGSEDKTNEKQPREQGLLGFLSLERKRLMGDQPG